MKNNGLKDSCKSSLVFILTFVSLASTAQNEIIWGTTVEKEGFTCDIHLIASPSPDKTVKDVYYFWYRSGQLKTTLGDYSGYLLHGLFEKFDMNNNLVEKGNFFYGAKNGNWNEWDNGVMLKEDVWNKGQLAKRKTFQNDTTIKENFRHDKLDGVRTISVGEKIILKEKYRKGEPVPVQDRFSWLKSIFRKKEDIVSPKEDV